MSGLPNRRALRIPIAIPGAMVAITGMVVMVVVAGSVVAIPGVTAGSVVTPVTPVVPVVPVVPVTCRSCGPSVVTAPSRSGRSGRSGRAGRAGRAGRRGEERRPGSLTNINTNIHCPVGWEGKQTELVLCSQLSNVQTHLAHLGRRYNCVLRGGG